MQLALPTGVTCVFDQFGPASAPAVVLLHGLSGNRDTYAAVIDHLIEVYPGRLQIVNVDLRGHGDSSPTPIEAYTAAGFAADIAALVTALDLDPALVVGHSLGGVVAASLAVDHPDVVSAIFLEDPPLFEGDDARRAISPVASFFPMLVAAVRGLQATDAPQSAYAELAATHSAPDEVAERARSLQRWDPTTMQAALDGVVWHGFDPMAAVGCPLTVLQADPEVGAVFEPRDAEALAAANPHARIHLVATASHSIHATATLPAYLAHLDAAIDQFLAS